MRDLQTTIVVKGLVQAYTSMFFITLDMSIERLFILYNHRHVNRYIYDCVTIIDLSLDMSMKEEFQFQGA